MVIFFFSGACASAPAAIANFAIEAEKMGDNTSYTAKIGVRF